MKTLKELKPGDLVERDLAGIKMPLVITEVCGEILSCGDWIFCRQTGMEIDEDLCWGPKWGRTGSYITAAWTFAPL